MANQKIRELCRHILQTKFGNREISRILMVSPNTVSRYRGKLSEINASWAELSDMDSQSIDRLINDGRQRLGKHFASIDMEKLDVEMRRSGSTLEGLWIDYKEENPETGYSYTSFCIKYQNYKRKRGPVMRQIHIGGEKMFVDFSGKPAYWTDPSSGDLVRVELFIAVLGASNYTYIEAVPTQNLADWISANVRALEFFGGSPKIIVCDNLKSAVTKNSWTNIIINRSYSEFASHYSTSIAPARPYKPKDKPKAEVGVQIAQRLLLPKLRKRAFYSLSELNSEIWRLLFGLNGKILKKRDVSRRDLFEKLDQSELIPLPGERFEHAEWKVGTKVGPDYHVEWQGHYYSVPYTLIGSRVDIKASSDALAVYNGGKRIALHAKANGDGTTTLQDHRPINHRRAQITADEVRIWAARIGPHTEAYVAGILQSGHHSAVQSAAALRRLGQEAGADRIEKACLRASAIGTNSLSSVRSILRAGLEDREIAPVEISDSSLITHDNIRGPHYFEV